MAFGTICIDFFKMTYLKVASLLELLGKEHAAKQKGFNGPEISFRWLGAYGANHDGVGCWYEKFSAGKVLDSNF